jgi:hypothetical protein
MSYSKSSLVLSRATLEDVPALAALYRTSFCHIPFFKQMMPDTSANDQWWREAHRHALRDSKSRVVKVTDQGSGDVVGFATWCLPCDDGVIVHPGAEEDRWPEFTKDVDQGLCDALFGYMGRARPEIMGDRKHYCEYSTDIFKFHFGYYSIVEAYHQASSSVKSLADHGSPRASDDSQRVSRPWCRISHAKVWL